MRHITQITITDRIFGTRRDRQGVEVTGRVRGVLLLLRLWVKRTLCHPWHEYQAPMAWFSARLTSADSISGCGRLVHMRSGRAMAFCRSANVEAVTSGRC